MFFCPLGRGNDEDRNGEAVACVTDRKYYTKWRFVAYTNYGL
jgi:hypothetical protein